jgi:hypothetical protein
MKEEPSTVVKVLTIRKTEQTEEQRKPFEYARKEEDSAT